MTGERRILVVDDEEEIRDLAAAVLSDAGLDVATAASGEEAIGRLSSEPFDLVLLDINMPRMDGWETLRLIRADERLGELGVVMFSVKGEVRDKVHSLQEGASDYVTKPFIIDDLVARVRRLLESTPPGREQRR
jgi:DNA-binding response OmpR family regulator